MKRPSVKRKFVIPCCLPKRFPYILEKMNRSIISSLLTAYLLLNSLNIALCGPVIEGQNENWTSEADEMRPLQFGEAPFLAEMVASGNLPPVEERLPPEPFVQKVIDQIGTYGGTWNRAWFGPTDGAVVASIIEEPLVRFKNDGSEIEPNIVKKVEATADKKVFVFHLREGVKWSDGFPFSAIDIQFFWENILTNTEVTEQMPGWLSPTDEDPRFDLIDDYTFRISFSEPYPSFIYMSALMHWKPYTTTQYIKNFLPDLAEDLDKANKIANERGFNDLKKFVAFFSNSSHLLPEVPTISAWIAVEPPIQNQFLMTRNPFYWKVDSNGNQLPYIDEVIHHIIQDVDSLRLKITSGEIDMQGYHVPPDSLSYLLDKSQQGSYQVVRWYDPNETAGYSPSVFAVSNFMHNVPEVFISNYYLSTPANANPCQFYFSDKKRKETLIFTSVRDYATALSGAYAAIEGTLQNVSGLPKISQSRNAVETPPDEEAYRPIITVLDFNVEKISASEAEILVDLLTTELFHTRKFRVIDRKQREKILEEQKFSYSGCVDESCQLEIGKLLSSENIVVGSIGKVATRFIFNVKIIDVETGETVSTNETNVFTTLDNLIDAIPQVAGELISR